MYNEIIVTLITAVAGVVIAIIQYRVGKKSNKNDHKSDKKGDSFAEIKDAKRRAFDEREEAYNELSMSIARHLIYDEDISIVQKKLAECELKDANYKLATARYIDALTKLADDLQT